MPAMNTDELIREACPKINALGAGFYFAPDTLATGAEHGLGGFELYVLGRGGVLGDVEAQVVLSAFGFFKRELVTKLWSSAREKMSPRDGGRLYVRCCQDFGRSRLAGLDNLDEFCDAAGAVNDAVDPAGLALYAALAAEPLPSDSPARAMQLLAVLREFRGSAHLLAVLASGLRPKVAHYIKRPDFFSAFGYGEDEIPEVSDDDRMKLAAAEELTDALVRPAFSVLDGAGADALYSGLEAIEKALAS